jgi:hypothetical protein
MTATVNHLELNVSATQVYVDALASILGLITLLQRGAIKEFVAGPREGTSLETILEWSEPETDGRPLPGAAVLCRVCGVPLAHLPEDERKSRAHAQACVNAVRFEGHVHLNRRDADMFAKLISCLL